MAGSNAPCCLVVGLLASDALARNTAMERLQARFGPCFYISAPLPFTYTDYYREEMGAGLNRRFMVFNGLQQAHRLPMIKQHCISLESSFLHAGGRKVNIDPGLLGANNFVLATTKSAAHRLLLGGSIYGELTLLLQHGEYVPLPWTYPDYASAQYRALMMSWRNRYLWLLKQY